MLLASVLEKKEGRGEELGAFVKNLANPSFVPKVGLAKQHDLDPSLKFFASRIMTGEFTLPG